MPNFETIMDLLLFKLETVPQDSPEFQELQKTIKIISDEIIKQLPDAIKFPKNSKDARAAIRQAEKGGIAPLMASNLTNGYVALLVPEWEGWKNLRVVAGLDYNATWKVAAFKDVWSFVFQVSWANGQEIKVILRLIDYYETLQKIYTAPGIVLARDPYSTGIIINTYPRDILKMIQIWYKSHRVGLSLRDLQ